MLSKKLNYYTEEKQNSDEPSWLMITAQLLDCNKIYEKSGRIFQNLIMKNMIIESDRFHIKKKIER
jgi:hypothetical protein